MATTKRWWSAGLLAGVLALAGPVGATGTGVLEAQGMVTAVHVATAHVEVSGRSYEVGPTAILEDLDGHRIGLAELPVQGDPPLTRGQQEPGAVAFRATRDGRGWLLLRLRLVPELPK